MKTTLNPLSSNTTPKSLSAKGFALVATILVMSMLMLLSISMLSMSSVTTKSSATGDHQQIANANARMAAMIALGELQKYAGPDQRVTFSASLFDDTPDTDGVTGIKHPHWIAVARADGFKGEDLNTPIIEFKDGGFTDRRSTGYDRKENVLQWLVSGSELDPEKEYDEQVLLMTSGQEGGDVNAPLVPIQNGQKRGGYAYWISDESSKANLSLRDPNKDLSVSFLDSESLSKLQQSQQVDLTQFFPNIGSVSEVEIEKIISRLQTDLTGIGHAGEYASTAEQASALVHDITPYSLSLLTDTLHGGLKKNLTAYLDSSGEVAALGSMPGVDDDDTFLISEERETIGPKYGSLRDWYGLKDKASGGLGTRTIDAQYANSLNSAGVDPTKFTKQSIHPVLTCAQHYGNFTYDRVSREIIELVYPRVTLWNPYNVKLKTEGMYVEIDFKMNRRCRISYRKSDGSTDRYTASINYNYGSNRARDYFFYIPPTEYEPGEAITFTTPAEGATYKGKGKFLEQREPQLNPLSATTDPSDLHCYYRNRWSGYQIKTLPDDADLDTLTAAYDGIVYNGNKETQTVKLFAAVNGATGPEWNELGNASFPKIQQIHMDNYSRGNNGRWMPYYPMGTFHDVNEVLGSDHPPRSLIGFGFRFKHFYESFSNRVYGGALNEPWYYAPMLHSNVRAGRSHRWPTDNMFGIRYSGTSGTSGARAHLYTYGPYAQERQFREWNDSANAPILSSNGNYISSVFQDNSNTMPDERTTLFEVPSDKVPLFSIANLQHVQLTPYVWDPSYIIGSGYANPQLPLDKSSFSETERDERWELKVNQLVLGRNENVHLRQITNNNPMVYDIVYESNHALWDKYFLSSLPKDGDQWDGSEWDEAVELPNSRLKINPAVKDSNRKEHLQDFHKAAQCLLYKGGFNANSTSVIAWKALLRSFNGIEQPNRVNRASTDAELKHPYSRFIVPHSLSGESPEASDGILWSGYRSLSDEEVDKLAEEIVVQVKKRGPFLSLSDFVNRRLSAADASDPELALFGTIQAAINKASLNVNLDDSLVLDSSLPSADEADEYDYGAEYWGGPSRTPYRWNFDTFEYDSKSLSEATGAPAYLTQADVLQKIGANLTVRGDTFVIRAYGDSRDNADVIQAKAWCEVVVQRTVTPVNPDREGLNPIATENSMGRKFEVIGFRWVGEKELTKN